MPAYIVSAPVSSGVTTQGGVDRIVVFAHDAADALDMAESYTEKGGNANWAAGTATEIAAAADMQDWRLQVIVSDTSNTEVVNETYTGIASDVLDDLGTGMATLLNATAPIANASYTGATQVLIIAQGASDALGDHSVIVKMFPPVSNGGEAVTIAGFVGAITDEGAGSADLSVTLAADAHVVPSVPVGLVAG